MAKIQYDIKEAVSIVSGQSEDLALVKETSLSRLILLEGLVKQFYHQGYCIIPNLYNPKTVEKFRKSFERLKIQASILKKTQTYRGTQFVLDNERILRIVWVCAIEPQLKLDSCSEKLLSIVCKLLDTNRPQHIICQAHFKEPGDLNCFDWHQDSEHRRYGTEVWQDINGRGSFVQTVTAIDPMTIENGPIMLIPKSSSSGHLALDKGNNRKTLVDESKLIPVTLEPGSVLCFGPYLIHGSLPNQSSQSRRVLINGFAYPGANSRQYPGEGSGYYINFNQQ